VASIYIETFGCQMNQADSEFIAQRARSAGYSVAERPEQANVLVLNTCTVRQAAERRAYGRMNHLKVLKDADPTLKLIVTGCLAEQDRDRMQQLAPHVDAVFGTSELVQLGDAIARWRPEFEESELAEERLLLEPFGGAADCITDAFSHLRGFATVQRGCSYYCTFCIVPHVRGRFDHRPMSDIVQDVRDRTDAGAREVMLVGQTVNAYRDPASGADFGELCKAVGAIETLERLSFISPHPKDFTESVVRALADVSKLNPRVHLPLQSASDAVLRRMNRKYTLRHYDEVVALFRCYLPDWIFTTDIIVGFPGETDADFEATLSYVRSGIFANAYMFLYSPRRGTPAARWEQTPAQVAKERFNRLVEAQNATSRRHHERKIGTVVRALVQGPSKKDASKIAAKALDNSTIIAPLPPAMRAEQFAETPWLDVAIDAGYIWGCTGTIVSHSRRFDECGTPMPRSAIDLIAI